MSSKRYNDVTGSRKRIVFNNFLGGIAWGVGATIGLSLVLAILAFIVQQLHFIPGVGESASDIYKSIIGGVLRRD